MGDYLTEHTGTRTRSTPQSEPMREDQQLNAAGGYVFEVDDWVRAERFLILGTEGGSYYTGQHEFTRSAAEALARCIDRDGLRAVQLIVSISDEGRAAKNDPAIFGLAMASAAADPETRRLAFDALPQVCRIGTHLFHFCQYRELFGGWGRGARRAVGGWYTGRDADSLAYQLVKYRQRDGWSHADVLRLAHPKPPTLDHDNLFKWATAGDVPVPVVNMIEGFIRAQISDSPQMTANVIRDYNIPREAVQPEHLSSPVVWRALLQDMPLTALIRNLATLTRVGVLKPMSDAAAMVAAQLGDVDRLRKARVHPFAILAAMNVYSRGFSEQGRGEGWVPVTTVVDALDAAFYNAFENVQPAGRRTLLAFDVSGSMSQAIMGTPALNCRMGSAAMGLITAATEPQVAGMAFTGPGNLRGSEPQAFPISGTERLDDVARRMDDLPMGTTDCSIPMRWAEQEGIDVETFVVYTDNETWAGSEHPVQALCRYRERFCGHARLIVVGMSATEFSIADPNDAGMLDVVGFDTAAPALMAEFSRGAL